MPILLFAAAAATSTFCVAAARDIAAGEAITASLVTAIPCRSDAGEPPVRYDRHARMLIATVRISAGTYLGGAEVASGFDIATGTRLILRSSAGPVTIEREVVTLQPGRTGRRVFVRDGDGKVFAAALHLVDK